MAIIIQSVEELNSGPPKTNPSSGREEDLNPGPPDYKSSALTTRPRCLRLNYDVWLRGCRPEWAKKINNRKNYIAQVCLCIMFSMFIFCFLPRVLKEEENVSI